MKVQRWLNLRNGLFLVLVLLLLGCGRAQDEVLRMGLANAPVSLDPRFATDATSTRINRLLYGRLVEFDESSRPVPSLAEWRLVSPRHYRFTLNASPPTFTNGAPLTSRDVKATFDFILDEAKGSPHRNTLRMVERIETPDANTVDFILKRPDVLFPAYLAIGILPADLILRGHPFQDHPVGNGPFRLMDWPEEGRLRLERRGDGQAVEFLLVKDPTVRVLKLLRGEIDMLQNDIPPELIGYLEAQDPISIIRTRGSNFSYLGFNLRDSATADLQVRRAIAHAIDRSAIIRYALGGSAQPAQALLPPTHWAGAEDLEPYAFAPARARELLRQAGYADSRPLRLVYKTSSDPFRIRLATIIQNQLQEVGIRVVLRSYDWGTFYGDIKSGRFQMYSLAWVGIKTPDIFRYVYHSGSVPPEGANRGRFASPAVDRLIEEAEAGVSIDLQAPVYHRLQVQLLEELPYVPLWYEDQVLVLRRGVEDYLIAGDGNYDGLIRAWKKGN
jgi:peptide/nickel transport system substrate-binding protein